MYLFKKSILLKKLTDEWLLYKKVCIKQSTYFRYKYIIEKYILTYFKNKDISYLINYDFNIYINYLSKSLSPKTIKDILSVLKSILQYAEKKFNINFMLDLIAIPKYEQNEIKILKDNERKKLEQYCIESNNLKNFGIVICLNTGLRIGEICALTWSDINLKENVFIINKTMQRLYKGKRNTLIQISTPKTKNSIRKIPISNKLHNILKEIKKVNHYKEDMYFLTGSTKFIEPRNYQDSFKKCLKECNISNHKFHVLRHTFATNCIKIGMDIKSLSQLLGHSDVNITLNRYVHSSFSIQRKYLNKL